MATRYWFEPHPGCPMIELGCGYHDKNGKFYPQNIRLTGGPSRFLTQAAMKHARKYRGAGMVGDPNVRIKAIESLAKIERDERDLESRRREGEFSVADIHQEIREIAKISPELAEAYAKDKGVAWLPESQKTEVAERR